jgi:hypothetical protein
MQEIKHDGTRGEKKEGAIEDLLGFAKESLEKDDVAGVLIFKGEEMVLDLSPEFEKHVRKIVKEEMKISMTRGEPLFQKIIKELRNG